MKSKIKTLISTNIQNYTGLRATLWICHDNFHKLIFISKNLLSALNSCNPKNNTFCLFPPLHSRFPSSQLHPPPPLPSPPPFTSTNLQLSSSQPIQVTICCFTNSRGINVTTSTGIDQINNLASAIRCFLRDKLVLHINKCYHNYGHCFTVLARSLFSNIVANHKFLICSI